MTSEAPSWFVPDWPLPAGVHALQTIRGGGASAGPYAAFNLGDHVGDAPAAVALNRRRLAACVPGRIGWLQQVHGTAVADLDHLYEAVPVADAAIARERGVACAIMTADCLPVLFCAADGSVVGAAHAGWRGLLAGVLEATVSAMAMSPGRIRAWLGPAIGPEAFEVGAEVRDAFVARDAAAAGCFRPLPEGKWLADLHALARQRLADVGVTDVAGGDACTFRDADRFFSYRRDGITGRMATLIWRD